MTKIGYALLFSIVGLLFGSLKGLNSDADAVHAGIVITGKLRAVNRAGIGLKSNFAAGLNRKFTREMVENLSNTVSRKNDRGNAIKQKRGVKSKPRLQ